MFSIDPKTTFIDAGGALFTSRGSFGTVLGQTKAEMEEFGKVYRKDEVEGGTLSPGTGDFDLLLDASSLWRKRYILALVEDAGDTEKTTDQGEPLRRYAVSLKEGNRSTALRAAAYLSLIILPLALSILFKAGALCIIASVALALAGLYLWAMNDPKAPEVSKHIKEELEKGVQTNLPR
ncbi:MAG: hypothetical protein IJV54_00905 [Bacteroidales bacterium]|nr:hypothetical protein [Bacteroidales bacterium]MBQ9710834.1 hypothetical protein [Bacteroidales bacterium]MBR1434174.1 hypothetical protein [Bacteroidales bacterium]